MFKKKNVIDELTKENAKLRVEQKRIEDDKNYNNSILEAKIKKLEATIKALNDETYRNDDKAKNSIAEIERKIKKNVEQMQLETKYYADITKSQRGDKNE